MAAFRSSHAEELWIPAEDGFLRLPNELFVPNMPWTTQNPEGYQRVHKDIPEGLGGRHLKAHLVTPISLPIIRMQVTLCIFQPGHSCCCLLATPMFLSLSLHRARHKSQDYKQHTKMWFCRPCQRLRGPTQQRVASADAEEGACWPAG